MAEKTNISWCDHTWNPWFGCTEVSPACDFCYARVLMDERYHKVTWGVGEDRIRTAPANWRQPLKWDRAAATAGVIRTVFCLSLGDIWDNEVDPEWRFQALDVMRRCHNLIFLLLSKRIGNAIKMATGINGFGVNRSGLPANAALGATMIDQEEWDRDLPNLLHAGRALGARFTFASVEPMLGPIVPTLDEMPHWVIVGGESGTQARPMQPAWARGLRDRCAEYGVPFHFKQWGTTIPDEERVGQFRRVTKHVAGRLLDGREHNDLAPL